MEVELDPRVVSFASLLRHAEERDCAIKVFTRSDDHQRLAREAIGERAVRTATPIRGVKDDKYYASRTALKHLPMTPAQAARVNAAVKDAAKWLSPRQRDLLAVIKKHPDAPWPTALHTALAPAWKAAHAVRTGL